MQLFTNKNDSVYIAGGGARAPRRGVCHVKSRKLSVD
jgi:hypothetical protein